MPDPRTTEAETERKGGRKIPPLVWIVIAVLVAWLVAARLQQGGTHVMPHGGTTPEAAEGPAVMPPAPAGPGAPATPGGTVNGPAQPAAPAR